MKTTINKDQQFQLTIVIKHLHILVITHKQCMREMCTWRNVGMQRRLVTLLNYYIERTFLMTSVHIVLLVRK